MIVFHHNDSDGRCSASIIRAWLNSKDIDSNIDFIEMDYSKPVPVDNIKDNDFLETIMGFGSFTNETKARNKAQSKADELKVQFDQMIFIS